MPSSVRLVPPVRLRRVGEERSLLTPPGFAAHRKRDAYTGYTQFLTRCTCRMQPGPPPFPRRGHSFVRTNHGTTTRAASDAERALGQGMRPELVEGTVDADLLAFAEVRLHPEVWSEPWCAGRTRSQANSRLRAGRSSNTVDSRRSQIQPVCRAARASEGDYRHETRPRQGHSQ